jgi:hypothetical protein
MLKCAGLVADGVSTLEDVAVSLSLRLEIIEAARKA